MQRRTFLVSTLLGAPALVAARSQSPVGRIHFIRAFHHAPQHLDQSRDPFGTHAKPWILQAQTWSGESVRSVRFTTGGVAVVEFPTFTLEWEYRTYFGKSTDSPIDRAVLHGERGVALLQASQVSAFPRQYAILRADWHASNRQSQS